MKLKKIDFTISSNRSSGVCEKCKSGESYTYQSVVGLFGKNGNGKTRTLKTVYNTIKNAIKENDDDLLDGITENAQKKILFLNANKILEIRNKEIRPIEDNKPFDEKLIYEEGIQDYLINNGKSLLMYMGIQWHQMDKLSKNSPTRIFSELFNKYFDVEFRAVFDPNTFKPNLEVDSLDIDIYELSEGEWIIVFYLLLFTLEKCSKNMFSDSIIIIDEIENYLNPKNIRMIMEGLFNAFEEKGQIWIASHSLDALLAIDLKKVYHVEREKVEGKTKTIICKPNINSISKIREELYGGRNESYAATTFREEEIFHYFENFMEQSLLEPATVSCINENDIQLKLFLNCISTGENAVKILDFGAGQGRIGDALKKIKNDKLLYYAYDIKEENSHIISKKKYAQKVYSKNYDIDEEFDVILLCNVLHEIDILSWVDELNFIFSKLSETGILVLIEDMELPDGEYIDETGFILLDNETTKILFGDKNVSLVLAGEEKYRERILCAMIDKHATVTKESVILALDLMRKRNIEKIWQIRRNKKDRFVMQQKTLGMTMARASQLVVNSSIAMEYIQSIDKSSEKELKKFINGFVNSLLPLNDNRYISSAKLEKVISEVWQIFICEENSKWITGRNIALAGSLGQRVNNILECIGMKMYDFDNLIQMYLDLKVYEHISEKSYRNLMSRLVVLDISNRYC